MSFEMVFVSSTYSYSESNPSYGRQKKMAPAGNECCNVFFFDGF